MYSAAELIRKIREESGLTQNEFAEILSVSTVLISMVETGQKEVSKKLISKLAEKLEVHPNSVAPFMFVYEDVYLQDISKIESVFIRMGEKLQAYLIKTKAKNLRKYVKK